MNKVLDALGWFPFVVLFVVTLLALASCAAPMYGCLPTQTQDGRVALVCAPIKETPR